MKMLTERIPQHSLKELAIALSLKISITTDPSTFFCDEEVNMLRNLSRNVTNGVPAIKILMFSFNCGHIWIDSNRALVCFYFFFDFIIYFCIQPSCFFIYMVSSRSNYKALKSKCYKCFILLK